MSLYKSFDQVIQYFSAAIARIFGPTDDAYPATGVQPFEGSLPKRSRTRRRVQDW